MERQFYVFFSLFFLLSSFVEFCSHFSPHFLRIYASWFCTFDIWCQLFLFKAVRITCHIFCPFIIFLLFTGTCFYNGPFSSCVVYAHIYICQFYKWVFKLTWRKQTMMGGFVSLQKCLLSIFGRFLNSSLCLYVWVIYMVWDHFSQITYIIAFMKALLVHGAGDKINWEAQLNPPKLQ